MSKVADLLAKAGKALTGAAEELRKFDIAASGDDAAPKAKGKPPADDDDDAPPPKAKAKPPADDDDDEPPAPKRGRPPGSTNKPKPPADDDDDEPPAKKPKAKPPADDDDDEPPAKKPTKKTDDDEDDSERDRASAALVELQKHDPKAVKAVFAKFNASRLRDIEDDQMGAVIKAANKALAAAKAASDDDE